MACPARHSHRNLFTSRIHHDFGMYFFPSWRSVIQGKLDRIIRNLRITFHSRDMLRDDKCDTKQHRFGDHHGLGSVIRSNTWLELFSKCSLITRINPAGTSPHDPGRVRHTSTWKIAGVDTWHIFGNIKCGHALVCPTRYLINSKESSRVQADSPDRDA